MSPYPFRKPWIHDAFVHGFIWGVEIFWWSEEENTPMEFCEGIYMVAMDIHRGGIP